MALSYSTGVKDTVANLLYSSTYAALGAGYQQTGIDKWGAYVLTELEEWSKWFAFATAAGSAPDQWEPWFVQEVAARLMLSVHPDRAIAARKQADISKRDALDSYCRLLSNYDPASTTEAFVYQMTNARKYVLAHCIRLKPMLVPDMLTVDGAFERAYTSIWKRAGYIFRRRPVVMTVTRTAFTSGVWATTGKTITVASAPFTASTTLGSAVYITGGTNANLREYAVTSATTTVLTLPEAIGATDGATDIAGYVVTISFTGLESGETFDGIASTLWRYTSSGHEMEPLRWATADDFTVLRAYDGVTADQPRYFRTHDASGTAHAFRFSPPPDATYTLRGEVFTTIPADPASATATTLFDKFNPAFLPVLRDKQLASVLTAHGRHNPELTRAADDAIEDLFPTFQDPGEPDNRVGVTDVYGDTRYMSGADNAIGGAL